VKRLSGVAAIMALHIGALLSVSWPAQAQTRSFLSFGMHVGDLGTGDPHFAASSGDRIVADLVFNGLLRYKPGDSTVIESDLAQAVPQPVMASGKQTWTFALRKGVRCHAGPKTEAYELTADDVVYSFKKSADAKRSAYSADYRTMSVEKTDAYTVRITLAQPLSKTLFLPRVTNYGGGFIVCAKAIEAMGDDAFKTHPIGTGPFMFKSYRTQSKIELIANDDYFRGKPKLGGVNLIFMPDATTREAALRTGEIHAGLGLPEAQWVDKINAVQGLKADVFGVAESYFVTFNTAVKPLDDPRVRQAIAHAIDRDAHVALFRAPVAEKIFSVVPSQYLDGGLSAEEAVRYKVDYAHNVARARQLMTDAGYPNGFSIPAISSQVDFVRRNYELLQSELKAINIDLRFTVVDHPTYHAQIRKDASPIVIYAAWRPNADQYLSQFFHSDAIVVTGKAPVTNFSHYTKIDSLIEQARGQTDPAKQAAIWRDANVKLLEDMAAFPIMVVKQVYGRTRKLDYGHELKSSLALYPQITEQTAITP
jgi:peptide/nickel transport system substrate-binding protein